MWNVWFIACWWGIDCASANLDMRLLQLCAWLNPTRVESHFCARVQGVSSLVALVCFLAM